MLFSREMDDAEPNSTVVTCPICWEAPSEWIALACNHQFCATCLRSYVDTRIHEGEAKKLKCPAASCSGVIDTAFTFDTDPQASRGFPPCAVAEQSNKLVRYCPRSQCGERVACSVSDSTFTCPSCRAVGCVRCRGSAHRFGFFCRADVLEEASFLQWVKSVGGPRVVRACPQCGVQIWKTGGCNHVTCARCRLDFCWVCRFMWATRHNWCRDAERRWGLHIAPHVVAATVSVVFVAVVVAFLRSSCRTWHLIH